MGLKKEKSNFVYDGDEVQVILNENLVCRNCSHLIPERTADCERYPVCKPIEVLNGGACPDFVARKQ
jgi:hypothetical protein